MEDKKAKQTLDVKTPETSAKEEVREEKEKTFTQSELNDILKARLARQEKETEEKIRQVQEETERLAKLTAEEKEKELVEKNRKEMDQRLAEVSKRENRLDAIEMFAEAKVPTMLVDFVISNDKEKTLADAKTFVDLYNESVSKSVAEQLKGTPPKDVTTNSKEQPTKKVVTAF